MNEKTLREALILARRFVEQAKDVQSDYRRVNPNGGYTPLPSPKKTGALRRTSMDLTRALAEMRKPG